MTLGKGMGCRLKTGEFELNCLAASGADQVMVMVCATNAVAGLSIARSQGIGLTKFNHVS
jgi:hypothetical protein